MKFKLITLCCLLVILTDAVSAQNPFFGHLRTPAKNFSGTFHNRTLTVTTAGDSIYTGFRPTATAAYGYSKDGGNAILAFAGFGYEHDTYKSGSQHWYTDYSISLQIGTGASNGSVSLANATTIGLFGSFLNHLITLGIGYNFANKSALPLVGPGIAFH